MGRLTGRHRRQNAVLWTVAGKDKFNRPTLNSPVDIRVRWIDKQEESLDQDGEAIRTDVTVKTDRSISIGSIMWLGRKRDLPSPVTNIYEVVSSNEVPNLKNRETRYTVKLIRYGDTLPSLA